MPRLSTHAHKQFYSVNPCGESMANWVYASQGKIKSLHFTLLKQAKSLCSVRCRIYLQFLLSLPQTAVAKYVTQMLAGDNRR
jgi:hypothetical protein